MPSLKYPADLAQVPPRAMFTVMGESMIRIVIDLDGNTELAPIETGYSKKHAFKVKVTLVDPEEVDSQETYTSNTSNRTAKRSTLGSLLDNVAQAVTRVVSVSRPQS